MNIRIYIRARNMINLLVQFKKNQPQLSSENAANFANIKAARFFHFHA